MRQKLLSQPDGKEKAKVSAQALGEDKPRKIFSFPVKHGVTTANVLAIALIPILLMLVGTYVNAQTIFLLEDPTMFDVPKDKLGIISSQLSLWGFPFAIAGTLTSGYIYDIFGRRLTLFTAFAVGSILVLFVPYTSPHVFPWLFIIRIGYQICMTAPASSPLIADYIHKDAIGKAASIIGIGYIVGEVLSMGVLFNVTAGMSYKAGFMTVAIVGLFFSCCLLFMIREPLLRKKDGTGEQTSQEEIIEDVVAEPAVSGNDA